MGRGKAALRAIGEGLKGGAKAWQYMDERQRYNRGLDIRERAAEALAESREAKEGDSTIQAMRAMGIPLTKENYMQLKYKQPRGGGGGGGGAEYSKSAREAKGAYGRIQAAAAAGIDPDPVDVAIWGRFNKGDGDAGYLRQQADNLKDD